MLEHTINMSTPPPYTSRINLPKEALPPYSSTQTSASQLPRHSEQSTHGSRSCIQESQPETPTYLAPLHDKQHSHHRTPSSSSSGSSKKSRWRQLKQENEERKARTLHVTHEQAANILGHDKEWLREREMAQYGENRWVQKGSGGCVVM